MTIPKVTRDLLMLAPSFNLSPTAPLALARSLRKKICVKEKANNKHSLYHQLASFKLYQTHQVSPAPVVYKRLELLLFSIANTTTLHTPNKAVGHMTLYHQDPVATLSRPSEGPSHSSWGTISVSREQHKLHGIAIHCSIFPSSYHWDSETPIHLPREFTA